MHNFFGFVAPVVAVLLFVMWFMGEKPFGTLRRFAFCFGIALILAIVFVGGISLIAEPSTILRAS